MRFVALALLFAAASVFGCENWLGTVWLNNLDGTYTLLDNEVLYNYSVPDVVLDDGSTIPGSTLYATYGWRLDPTQVTYVVLWLGAVDWLGVDDSCQFSFGYRPDVVFFDEFEG